MTKSNKIYHFLDDYSEGCHPYILELMSQANLDQQTAYGQDTYSEQARQCIRQQLRETNAPIFFISGGTLSNLIIIASALKSHEAIIAAESGHISQHETGAIEATGHKIITVPTSDGKLTSTSIETALAENSHFPHMAKPRLVYISNATELGTVYTKAELTALAKTCQTHHLLLMLDGARLSAALTSQLNDLTLNDIFQLTDFFWIGGTKAGAFLGEAIVIPNQQLSEDFEFHIKQRGALLAKGRLLGLQFLGLFQNELYFELALNANKLAKKLSSGIENAGFPLVIDTQSNQVFPVLPIATINKLQQYFSFHIWQNIDQDHCSIRLVTSWATKEQHVHAFLEKLNLLKTHSS